MSRATLGLVLIVSCAHLLVHVYELSLPSVEQEIAKDYDVSTETTGLLSTYWRLPWGLGALGAGWLVDRYGARRMLVAYLLGCAGMCVLAGLPISLPTLFGCMFAMGTFASIYHPAGLALISHETSIENRTRALSIHGIFGTAGFGSAFLAGLVLQTTSSWRLYYWLLAVPGVLLGLVFIVLALRRRDSNIAARSVNHGADDEQDRTDWKAFFTLMTMAMLTGFTYSAVLAFLPRYMDSAVINILGSAPKGAGNYLTGGTLLVGCMGQFLAGRIARPAILERQFTFILFGTVPCLIWMAVAQGWGRVAAAAMFSLIHFMHQPIYNSLVAKYTPRRRRSLCYGLGFAMASGIGSVGAWYTGFVQDRVEGHAAQMEMAAAYGTSAAIAAVAGILGIFLWRHNHWGG